MARKHLHERNADTGRKRLFTIWSLAGLIILLSLSVVLLLGRFLPMREKLTQSMQVALNYKGSLEGKVIENYPGNPPAKNIQVMVDGKRVKMTSPGSFRAKDLAAAKHSLVIRGEGYEEVVSPISIKKGVNALVFEVCLTPEEATRRWMEAKQKNRFADSYRFLHPDERSKVKESAYINRKVELQNKYGLAILKFTVSPAKSLESWKHPVSGKLYKDVVRLHTSVTLEMKNSGAIRKNWDTYAQKCNGRWQFFAGN